ncbi:MAG: glycosyltransferase family 39 protein [Acidobacteriota bacterium]
MDFSKSSLPGIALPVVGAAALLYLLSAATAQLMPVEQLDFGRSLNLPTPVYALYLAVWMAYASLAAGLLALGLARWLGSGDRASRLQAAWMQASDRKWIVYTSLFAFLIPAALRTYLLGGAPLTDDASAYRYMAQVLAGGNVYGESHPLKLFFDNRFMINDGKVYSHFFIGWPALMVPGVLLGIPGLMNAVYSALTVPALFAVLRRLTSSAWARAGAVLYLSSPMLMLAAATETSHTSCVAALAWLTWLCLRSRDADAPGWVHPAVAVTFCIAFFIRPTSALGVGGPLLVWWLLGLKPSSRVRAVISFALPAMALAALFLTVNKLQTGAFFEVAYQRAFTYAQENDFRFSLWPPGFDGGAFTELEFRGVERSLAILGAALYRLNVTFLGWPCSLLFAAFAGRGKLRSTLRWSILTFLILHFYTNNVGIDTFAPMHYFELAWPFLLLNLCGLHKLTQFLAGTVGLPWRFRPSVLPTAALTALIGISLLSYTPLRFGAIGRIADNIAMPQQAVAQVGLGRSVIFVQHPFIQYCRSAPAVGWVFVRPNNDPQLENAILWVNHLSVEKNKLLMQRFPDRKGYILAWDPQCRIVFLDLERLGPGSVPDAPVSGIDQVGT